MVGIRAQRYGRAGGEGKPGARRVNITKAPHRVQGRPRRGPSRAPSRLRYFSSTSPPASSRSALSLSASSRSMPSLTGPGAPSTTALASLRPRPVAARTALMTWIFFSPAAGQDHVDGARSSSAPAPSPPPAGGGRRGGDRGRGDAELLLERLDALGELEHRDALQLLDPLRRSGLRVQPSSVLLLVLGGDSASSGSSALAPRKSRSRARPRRRSRRGRRPRPASARPARRRARPPPARRLGLGLGGGRASPLTRPCSATWPSCAARPAISWLSVRTTPVSGLAAMPTSWPRRTSTPGSLAIELNCRASSAAPSMIPPLYASTPFCLMKSAIAFAARTASPRTKVSAVGPTRCSSRLGGAGVVGRALGEPVLDDRERGVGLAQLASAARRPGAPRCRGSRPRRRRVAESSSSPISATAAAFCLCSSQSRPRLKLWPRTRRARTQAGSNGGFGPHLRRPRLDREAVMELSLRRWSSASGRGSVAIRTRPRRRLWPPGAPSWLSSSRPWPSSWPAGPWPS